MKTRRATGTALVIVGAFFFIDAFRFVLSGPSDERAWHIFGSLAAAGLIALGVATLLGKNVLGEPADYYRRRD